MTTTATVAENLPSNPTTTAEIRPVKVMHVITDLDVGGAERMLVSYLTAERTSGPNSFVVSLLSGGYFAKWLRKSGLNVHEMNMGRAIGNLLSLFRIALIIRREKPDVIQSWMYHADLVSTLALLLSGRKRQTHLYWGVRCSDMDTSKYRITLRFAIWACSWLSWIPDGIIANSYAGMNVHMNLGYNGKNFFVIPNGVDANRFAPNAALRTEVRRELDIPDDTFAIAMVARRDPMKDHETFVSAINLVPGAIGVLPGKGTKELPDQTNLRRLGVREDIERIYAGCDVVCLCSAFGEGFPNVLVEGMSAGLAPIATDVGDCARIVGDVGEIVPPRDVNAFAEALRNLIGLGREKLLEKGQEARRRIQAEYALERAVDTFDNVYKSRSDDEKAVHRSRPILAVSSAVVSRLATFGALIAAARFIQDPDEYGVFAVLTALVGVVNAVVSGGGDMWLNSFTGSLSRTTGQAPRISQAYLIICGSLAFLMASGIGLIFLVSANPVVSTWLGEMAPGLAVSLSKFPFATMLAVVGASFAGLFEALLAILRAGNRVTAFFTFRDLTTPVIVLALIVLLKPASAIEMMAVYCAVWGTVFALAFFYIKGALSVLPKLVSISARRWLSLLRHTAGLIYGNFGSRLSIHIDVLVLANLVSIAFVGEYRAAAQFAIGFMVVQHFVFLSLPWQMRRTSQSGEKGPGYAWVILQQRTLLLVASAAFVLLWIFAEELLGLLGERFVAVADIFRIFLMIRFIDLLWGPNHEMLVSNGYTVRDAHANIVALLVWGAVFGFCRVGEIEAVVAAVNATALAAFAGQATRYRMLLIAGLVPVMGHRLGPALPIALTGGVITLSYIII
jgi:glycosyltransferase involved in cell wall biosynthesis/O-antigen/teichoic acid export membrane protein